MDYKKKISNLIKAEIDIEIEEIKRMIEIPVNPEIGDYTFPCFHLVNTIKKAPSIMAEELSRNIKCDEFERIVNLGPYLNFFIDKSIVIKNTLEEILNKGDGYGNFKGNESKDICIEYESSNIDKAVDSKALLTTIVGNSLYNLFRKSGYKVKRLSDLEYWTIQFGELSNIFKGCNSKGDIYSGKIDAVIKKLRAENLLIECNGVETVMLEEYNMPPYIILNKKKEVLYQTKDLAVIIDRKKKYDFCKYIFIDILPKELYFKKMFKVLELAEYSWASDCIYTGVALVKFEDGKFLRVKIEDIIKDNLINDSVDKVLKLVNENSTNIESRKDLAEKIIKNAIIIYYLKNSRKKEIVFELNDILSLEEGGGLYVQYSYEIAKSILRKSVEANEVADFSKLNSKEEFQLVKLLGEFKGVIDLAIDTLEPFIITKYIIEVTNIFNIFYKNNLILELDNKKVMKARLLLVEATCQVLKNALKIICFLE